MYMYKCWSTGHTPPRYPESDRVSSMWSMQMWAHCAAIQKEVSLGVWTWKEVHDRLPRKKQVSMVWPHFYFLKKL